jgi:hypothetical protein
MKLLRDRPQISHGLKIHQKPIKDRYKQVMNEKEQHLKDIRKKYKPTFAPEINSYVDVGVMVEQIYRRGSQRV